MDITKIISVDILIILSSFIILLILFIYSYYSRKSSVYFLELHNKDVVKGIKLEESKVEVDYCDFNLELFYDFSKSMWFVKGIEGDNALSDGEFLVDKDNIKIKFIEKKKLNIFGSVVCPFIIIEMLTFLLLVILKISVNSGRI